MELKVKYQYTYFIKPFLIKENKYKKILIVGTGALHSKTTVNIGLSIPSVSHAVSLEVISI